MKADAREHRRPIVSSFKRLRTKIHFSPLDGYWRDEYMVMYPPGSVYLLYVSGLAYRLVSPEMANTRLFNVFIGAPMVLAAGLVAWFVYRFVRREHDEATARATALVYWLSPVTLLDSTFQGYNNPIFALLSVAALTSAYRGLGAVAVVLTTLAIWTKPQGLLLALVIAVVLVRDGSWQKWPGYVAMGIAVSGAILLPFLVTGYALSSVLGATAALRSLGEWSIEVLSARSWNLWWPVQFVVGQVAGLEAIQLPGFQARFHLDARRIGSALMLIVWVVSLWKLWVELPRRRVYVFLCFVMMGLAYSMVQVNVQYNQFMVFMPVLGLVSLTDRRLFAAWAVFSIVGALQLVSYGGFGRDLCCVPEALARAGLKQVFTMGTLVEAAINVGLSGWMFREYLTSGFGAPRG